MLQAAELQVHAKVINGTDHDMRLVGCDLTLGNWMGSPVDTPHRTSSSFSSQGRYGSVSGTEGWAAWKLGDVLIRVTFSCPMREPNEQSIRCEPANRFKVSCQGTMGVVNRVVYTIEPNAGAGNGGKDEGQAG